MGTCLILCLDGGLLGTITVQKTRPAWESSLGLGSPWQPLVLLRTGGCSRWSWCLWPSKLLDGGVVLQSTRGCREQGSL